jgi:3-isopropylmalate/(R)-2-methylmalate dehydratase small subunit
MFNCGMLAVELPAATIDRLFQSYTHRETTVTTNFKQQVLKISADNQTEEIQFSLPEFARALVETGGWVEYADSHY